MACGNHAIIHRPIWRAAAASRFAVGSGLRRSRAALRLWLARSRQRRTLSDLDDHLLRDIGLTPGDAARERTKRSWRP